MEGLSETGSMSTQQIVSLSTEAIISTVSRKEVYSSTLDTPNCALFIRRGNRTFRLHASNVKLTELTFKDGNTVRKENTIKAVFVKAIWFLGGFPSSGRIPRPPFPKEKHLIAAFPQFEYVARSATYIEIERCVKSFLDILRKRIDILPNCQFVIDFFEVLLEVWHRLKDSGLRKAYHFLECAVKSCRHDGVEINDLTRYSKCNGVKCPPKNEMLVNIFTLGSWIGDIEGHSRSVTRVPQGVPLPGEKKPNVAITEGTPVIGRADSPESVRSDDSDSAFDFKLVYKQSIEGLSEYFSNKFVKVIALGAAKLSFDEGKEPEAIREIVSQTVVSYCAARTRDYKEIAHLNDEKDDLLIEVSSLKKEIGGLKSVLMKYEQSGSNPQSRPKSLGLWFEIREWLVYPINLFLGLFIKS